MIQLKILREGARLSQKKLGEIFNVAQNTICNWENGTREPSYEMLLKISNYFSVSVDTLLGIEGDRVGHALKEERESQGLSIKELANFLEISSKELLQYESEENEVRIDVINKFEEILGLSYYEFLDKYGLYDEQIPSHFDGDVNKYEAYKRAVHEDMIKENNQYLDTSPGQFIIATRDAKNMSKEELAKKAGISIKLLNRIESDKQPPKMSDLRKIAKVFNIDVWEIAGFSNVIWDDSPDIKNQSDDFDPQIRAIARGMKNLNPSQRDLLKNLVTILQQIPTSARYYYVLEKATDFLAKEHVYRFPLDPFKIIEDNNWDVCSYSQYAEKYHVTIHDITEAFGSEDGYTIFNGRNYSIAYNDTKPQCRILFTLMHEIGHIILNHLADFDIALLTRGGIPTKKYRVLEKEANSFSRNALAPIVIANELELNTHDVQDIFHMSYQASLNRLRFRRSDNYWISDICLHKQQNQFREFVYIKKNIKKCQICGFVSCKEVLNFCPVCGGSSLYRDYNEEVNEMIYNGIGLNENSKAVICPVCGNEKTNIEGEFCQICGKHIVNRCTNKFDCGKPLAGDERYCSICGSESTFLQNGILKPWDYTEENEAAATSLNDDDLPF
ncbi:helix-turn-helix domain-containing protein [Clostridium sp. 'deep sea']|uniref:helix-turn-helix domain-containing protein n=1 Tax=Clostridium sp. 'deep sea' TaxID=2779445 RepID=UPI0018966CA0|nr:helix-turn-helix domain-containing protein [Clostridium sp. 'deep sea']QOR34412.1 helix-turn-helix domain-containing protein [Clostridium sp. 'deep sea']